MSHRTLGWRDRLQIANTAVFLLLGIILAVRGWQLMSVPIFLFSGALTAYALYRFAWVWRFFRGQMP